MAAWQMTDEKLDIFYMQKNIQNLCIFLPNRTLCAQVAKKSYQISPFPLPHHSYVGTWIKLQPTSIEPQRPNDFGEVPCVKFGLSNRENIGDIRGLSNQQFFRLFGIFP